jgi:hypothetical protein
MVSCKGACFKRCQYAHTPILPPDQAWNQGKTGVLGGQVEFSYRAQAEVTAGLEQGVRLQSYHRTGTGLQRASAPQALPDTRDRWEIHGSLGSLLRRELSCNAPSQQLQCYQHHCDLRQVRPSVFAVTTLEQPLRGHGPVATRAGVVRAHACHISILPRAHGFHIAHSKSCCKKTTVRLCCCFRKRQLTVGIVLTQ